MQPQHLPEDLKAAMDNWRRCGTPEAGVDMLLLFAGFHSKDITTLSVAVRQILERLTTIEDYLEEASLRARAPN